MVAGALAATSPEVTAGAIGGAGVIALGISGSRLAAGVSDDGLRVGPATVIATAAAAVIFVTFRYGFGLLLPAGPLTPLLP